MSGEDISTNDIVQVSNVLSKSLNMNLVYPAFHQKFICISKNDITCTLLHRPSRHFFDGYILFINLMNMENWYGLE